MTDDTTDQQMRDSLPTVSRRNYLRVAGATAGAGILPGVASAAPDESVERTNTDREDFLWVPVYLMEDPPEEIQYENLLAYARRHNLRVVLSISRTVPETAERIDPLLQRATEYGVQCWLATGCFRDDFNAPQLIEDQQARETFLDRLGLITETYADYYPDGKIVLWHEAPLVGNWVPGGGWTYAAIRNLRDLGPQIFAWQRETIKEVSADIEVGPFPHFPYVEPGGQFGNLLSEVMGDLEGMNALPDFTFTDFYRGYREPGSGQEGANGFLRRMMQNATEETNGRPVYNLAQDHTINNGYTPSKESIRMNLQAALEGGADGVGWYFRTNYRQTNDSLTPNDPFLPNVGTVDSSPNTTTLTFSRDRFQYAYDQTFASREGFDSSEVFNLWIHGYDMDLFEHRLSLKTAEGNWEYIGDFNGYVDQEYVYSGNETEHVSIFHALDRERYLGENNRIAARIETADDSDGSEIHALYAVPFDANDYFAEPEAPDLIEQSATEFVKNQDMGEVSLASANLETTVSAGDTTRATLVGLARLRPSATEATVGERLTFEVEDTSGKDRWIESLEWTFGDGTTASGWWTEHRYDSPGTYSVTLTATDNTGYSTTHEVTITVGELATPLARVQPSATAATVDERLTFEVEDTSGEDRWIDSLEWTFGDGTTASGWWTEHRYDSPGTYSVALTATDNTGHATTHEVAITITE